VPTHPTETAHPAELLERVQSLTERVDELPDPQARELAQELLASVIAMYGDGLGRIMEVIAGSRDAGATIIDQLSQDGAVASLLLIHDLYPVSLEERVLEALDTVRPYMESHGGNVELVELRDGVARLALQGSCNGCAASRATLETAIEQALEEHAPDLAGLEVSGVTEAAAPRGRELPMAGLELPIVQSAPAPQWVGIDESTRPSAGGLRELTVGADALLLANVDESLLAYVNQCAACSEPLGAGELSDGLLRCPGCHVEFDLPRAGRAAGGEPLQLRPVPLLQDGGLRVAL
jgi:Fe-S cluster biogenesis protein NfuA/nitrite reductase/ring-hydroxylating ferredoxin subunit